MSTKLIITKNSEVDVERIVNSIQARAKQINPDDVNDYIDLFQKYQKEYDTNITPFILDKVHIPVSKKKGFVGKILNKIITKNYFLLWNTIGELLTKQQQINKAHSIRIQKLESQIEELLNKNNK